jgi:putative transposase
MTFAAKSKLPRLAREYYQGRAVAMWTHTIEKRAQGWLDDAFYRRFRELLLHAGSRYQLICPSYTLMPDHWHLVWMGLDESSDQHLATAFLRKHVQPLLGKARLQDRAHDHVLRDDERKRGVFQDMCGYVLKNPERAGLRSDWREWPFLGAMVVGYPVFDPREAGFWEDFWKIYNRSGKNESLRSRAGLLSGPAREERDGVNSR